MNEIAAARAQQGFEFMNCGADIVAITAWMSTEMAKCKQILAESKVAKGEEIKSSGSGLAYS